MDDCLLCESALDDGMLCVGCTKATRVRLEALPTLYRGLAPLLTPTVTTTQGRSASGGPAPIPVALDVLDMRGPGGMVALLESWVDAIRAERGHAEQRHTGSLDGRVDRATAALCGHLPWVALSWDQAGAFAAEIREVARSVSTMIRPPVPDTSVRIGYCPAVHENGTICGAVLRLGRGETVVVCQWCGYSYPPATWAGLKTFMDEDAAAAAGAA